MPSDPFLSRFLSALHSADPGEAAALYRDDAVMLSFEWIAEGLDAVRDHYRQFFEYHGAISSVDVDRSQSAGSRRFVEFTMRSERGAFQLVNAFLLDGERIRDHFSNVVGLEMNRDEVQKEA